MEKRVTVEHPGHEGAEVKVLGKNLKDAKGVRIKGGSGAGNQPVRIRDRRGGNGA
jgi:hypothetical protein